MSYPDAVRLMADLRGMGEANAVTNRRKGFSRRATLMRAAELYAERHADADGRLPATFQVIYLTAWAPHESQPQPLDRLGAQAGPIELGAKEIAG